MVTDILKYKPYIKDFIPCAQISERKTWENLPMPLRTALVESGEENLSEPFPVITISDYIDFSKTGNRSDYEEKMFARRRKLNSLVLAECVENRGRFLPGILNGIYCILEESTWCAPAHNTYIRDTPQSPLPDYTRPVIDLFAGETGSVLALTEYLLRPILDSISPFISKDIAFRLRERLFTPYLNSHFWWMGDGVTQMNNWTVWISQNILLSAFTRPDNILSAEVKKQILKKAAASIDYFLDEYGEDGCCGEGAQYYDRAGISLFHCLDIIDYVTNGALAGIFTEKKIRNIADYIRKVYIGGSCYVNFADCSVHAGRRGAGEYLFGRRTGLEKLSLFAANDFLDNPDKLLLNEENLYRRIVQIMNWEDMAKHTTFSLSPSEDTWFESTGLMISRDSRFLLAVKAGGNGDSHNHNDVGSFIVYKDGHPLFIDLGVETYCQKTFSDRRYEIWTMQSQYHNLPSLGQFLQQPGSEFKASDVTCSLTQETAQLSMEISGAYRLPGSDAGCISDRNGKLSAVSGARQIRSYHRSASLIKNQRIIIEDVYDGDLPSTLNLMTQTRPDIIQNDNRTWTLSFGQLTVCTVTGAVSVKIDTIPLTDPRLRSCWGDKVYRIRLEMGNHLKIEIGK